MHVHVCVCVNELKSPCVQASPVWDSRTLFGAGYYRYQPLAATVLRQLHHPANKIILYIMKYIFHRPQLILLPTASINTHVLVKQLLNVLYLQDSMIH